ncbi:hypothetical protein KFK09_016353 [Dendrobium nobile]|uniref:Uncharacterized protein n=1 Tax=Dendrobium nobile TaxID=94219 RepID=A0A8T3AZP7_DENNO|nr:hypothetical protein KFK09_016353 [Dendrobium nobile]
MWIKWIVMLQVLWMVWFLLDQYRRLMLLLVWILNILLYWVQTEDNNIEFPSSIALISLVANDASDCCLGTTVNVPVVDVSIALISSKELKNQLNSL